MSNKRLFISILTFLVLISMNGIADPDIGTTGSMAYYANELGKFGVGSGEAGPDGSLRYVFPLGAVNALYDSNSGRWYAGQTSIISRETKWGVPQYTDDDIFMLDGIELVYAGGNNPRLYHTRKESYAKIEYFDPGTANSYWKITNKDGSRSFYGNTTDSRIEGVGRPAEQPRVWALARSEDAGNFSFSIYFYDEDAIDGGFYLTKIVTGKTGADTNGFKAIKFFYEAEPNLVLSFREGARVCLNKRLVTVLEIIGCDNTGSGGEYSSAFKIDWLQTNYTQKSMISAITQYGTDVQLDGNGLIYGGSSLPTTTFEYGEIDFSFGSQQDWGNTGSNLRYKLSISIENNPHYNYSGLCTDLIDINGDCLPDRIRQMNTDSLRIYFNNGNGFGSSEEWQTNGILLCTFIYFDGDYDGDGFREESEGMSSIDDYIDINGDGLPDRVRRGLRIKFNNGSCFGNEQIWNSYGSDLRTIDFESGSTISDYLDMNGDGRLDRIWQGANSLLHIKFNNSHGFNPEVIWQSTGNYLREFNYNKITTDYIDMNGDGLPDRVWQDDNNNFNIRYNTGNGFTSEITKWSSLDPDIREIHLPNMRDYVDFNGDGFIDRIIQGYTSDLKIIFNTGNGFGNSLILNSSHYWLRSGDSTATYSDYIDMNGDGLLDRVYQEGDSSLHINMCNSNFPNETYLIRVNNSGVGITEYTYTPIDRNLNTNYKMKKWVLTTITTNDGFGESQTTSFIYSDGHYNSIEREDMGFKKIVTILPTGDQIETHYYQKGAEEGLVEKQITHCSTGEFVDFIYFIYEDYALRSGHFGYGITQTRSNGSPDAIVEAPKLVKTYFYTVDGTTSNERLNMHEIGSHIETFTYPDGTAGIDWFLKKKINEYDDYGNSISSTEGDYTPGDWGYDKTTQYAEYINDTVNWLFLPKRGYSYNFNSNNSWVQSSDKRYYYDNSTYGVTGGIGLLTKTEEYYDSTHYITKQIGYDNFGNVHTMTDAEGYTYTLTYDNVFKSFLVVNTSPLVNGINLTSTTEYNSLMLPYREIDPNGAVTESVYDVFMRVAKIISPGDSITYPTIEYEYHDTDGSSSTDGTPFSWTKMSMREVSGQSGTYDSYTFFDGLGNAVQTKKETLDENGVHCWNTVNRWYTVEGNCNLAYESLPFNSYIVSFDRPLIPEGVFSKTEEYFDPLFGRVKKNTDASGLITYLYQKHYMTTKVDMEEHVFKSEILPQTNESKKYYYTGTNPAIVLYSTITTKETFDKKKVFDNNGNEFVFYRDWLGREKEIHTPDIGTWYYNYDDNGNLLMQTDANNNIINMQYDELNRIIRKTYPNASFILYNYDGLDETGNFDGESHGYCLGNPTRIFYAGGLGKESFEYNIKGLITGKSKTIDGKTRVLRYEYDAIGRIVKEILPDNEQVVYAYSEGGNRTAVTGNYNYAFNLKYTPAQKLCSISYGNGITTNYDYYDQSYEPDSYSGIHYSQRLKQISTNVINFLNFNYSYDKSGNIRQKNDVDFYEFSEVFSYDDLNRLTGAYAEIYGNKNYAYDELNNITYKDGRSYSYTSAKPHAVTNDGVYDYVYDNNGNMIEKKQGAELVRGITYDYENRITNLSDGGTFSYDHSWNRISKQEGNIKTIYFFNNYEEVYESGVLTEILKYYFTGYMRVAQFSTLKGLNYIHSDHLGSSQRISDVEGKIVNILAYAPYGEELEIEVVPDIPDNVTITTPLIDINENYKARDTISISTSIEGTSTIDCQAGQKIQLLPGFEIKKGVSFKATGNFKLIIGTSSTKTHYKFTGKELDSSGLYYFGARYYDPVLGRWLTPDPAMDGLNLYTYCKNNPLRNIDLWGLLTASEAAINAVYEGMEYHSSASEGYYSNYVYSSTSSVTSGSSVTGRITYGSYGSSIDHEYRTINEGGSYSNNNDIYNNDNENNFGDSLLDNIPIINMFRSMFRFFEASARVAQLETTKAVFERKGWYRFNSFDNLAIKGAWCGVIKEALELAKSGVETVVVLEAIAASIPSRSKINYGSTPEGRPFTRHYSTETGPVRNIPGSVIDSVIDNNTGIQIGNGKMLFYDKLNNITVISGDGGSIVSARKGLPPRGINF